MAAASNFGRRGIVHEEYFREDERYSNALPMSNILWTQSERLMSCAVHCYIDANCKSFFNRNGECRGYGYRLTDNTPTHIVSDMKYYEMTGPIGNLAAGKPVLQSSTLHDDYGPENAVDSLRYYPTTLPSCSHTKIDVDNKPFWEVDLLSRYRITAVAFLSRQDCCGDRNSGLHITVAESSQGPYILCYHYPLGPGFINMMKTFYCTQPRTGSIVRISREESVLTVCEFEVYGFPLVKD
ncbi:fucolectin-like [Argopecten irradians]|uniref:fucolectin-like n=1 Tax=Argopecten irradians TaxID=31199 RepID=UPI0037147171